MTRVGHYIKPLTVTRMPKSWGVMTAASLLGGDRSGYMQTWRRGATYLRHETEHGAIRTAGNTWESDADMWASIHRWANKSGLSHLWTHDLQWTARVTQMLDHLPALGWRLDAFALNPGSSWMVWRKARHTLKVSDLLSVWPHGIERLGAWFGLGRKSQPAIDAPWHDWDAYVARDRSIILKALRAYMWWVNENELGTLAVTGNAQAWKAFRRRFITHEIVSHDDDELRALERRAMWTGRCEAYWRGSMLREVVDEWDFTMAHNEIVRTHPVPVFPSHPLPPYWPLGYWANHEKYAILVEVEVETNTPCVPTEMGSGIAWPIGRFRTALWSPEIRIALDHAQSVRLVRGWAYRLEPALAGWADWVALRMDADDFAVPVWEKDILKRWSNTLIGRFGMRYPKWKKVGTSPKSTVAAAESLGAQGETLSSYVQIGHDLWEESGWIEPHDSAPMITGYIMSMMRAKMWQLAQAMPEKSLLYMDTDSVLVADGWRRAMDELARQAPFRGLRLKRSWEGLSIYGPRQLVTGEAVRVSGLPKTADRLGRNEFEGEVTESLLEALRAGHPSAVHSVARQWKIAGEDTRRQSSGFGWTEPFEVNNV